MKSYPQLIKELIKESSDTYDRMYQQDMIALIFTQMILPRLQKLHPNLGCIDSGITTYSEPTGKNILNHFKLNNDPFVLPIFNRRPFLKEEEVEEVIDGKKQKVKRMVRRGLDVGHWASNIFHRHNNKLYIISLNSSGDAEESVNREMLKFLEANKKELGVESVIVATDESDPEYIKQYHQHNNNSCGPYALYNMEINFGLEEYVDNVGEAYKALRKNQQRCEELHKTDKKNSSELSYEETVSESLCKHIRDRYTKFAEEYSTPDLSVYGQKIDEQEVALRKTQRETYLKSLPGKKFPSIIDQIEAGKIRGKDVKAILQEDEQHKAKMREEYEKDRRINPPDEKENSKSSKPQAPKQTSTPKTDDNKVTESHSNQQPTTSRQQLLEQLVSGITNIRSYDKSRLVQLLQSSNIELPKSKDSIETNLLEKRAINDFSSFSSFCKSIYEIFTRIYYGEKLVYKDTTEQKFSLKSDINQDIIDKLLGTIKTEEQSRRTR